MERDFLGLGLNISSASVKEDIDDDGDREESGDNKPSASQWPFLSKISSLPHVTSLRPPHQHQDNKIVSDASISSRFMPVRVANNYKDEKCINHDTEVAPYLSLASNPAPYIASLASQSNVPKMFPMSNQVSSFSASNDFLKAHFTATMKQQLPGHNTRLTPHPVSVNGIIAGVTKSWTAAKAAVLPAQLTIFYAGTVNVYNGVSPEKARAIILAGNESSLANKVPPTAKASPLQLPLSGHIASDDIALVHPNNESHLSSPLSVSSHIGATQSDSGSTLTCTDDLTVATNKVMTTTPSKVDTESSGNNLMIATTEGLSTSAPSSKLVGAPKTADIARAVTGTAIPQARRASLARFLEKRKERVMTAAPYNLGKKSSE